MYYFNWHVPPINVAFHSYNTLILANKMHSTFPLIEALFLCKFILLQAAVNNNKKNKECPPPSPQFHQWIDLRNSFKYYRVYSKISLVQTLMNLSALSFSIICLASLDLWYLHFHYYYLASPWVIFIWIKQNKNLIFFRKCFDYILIFLCCRPLEILISLPRCCSIFKRKKLCFTGVYIILYFIPRNALPD